MSDISSVMHELTVRGEAVIDPLTINDVAEIYTLLDVEPNFAHFKMRGESLWLVIDKPLAVISRITSNEGGP